MRALVLLLLVASLLGAGVASAGEEDARTFFAEGRRLRLAGECRSAIVAFERARAAYPEGLGSRRNIAECQEELGAFASARRNWWELRREVLASGEARYDGWVEDAEAAHQRLADKVAKVAIQVVGEGAAGATIRVDGEVIEPSLRGVDLERDPGIHEASAEVDGREVASGRLRVESGERKVITLRVPGAPRPKSPPPEPTPSPPAADEGMSGIMAGAITAFSISGASLVGFGVALGFRQQALDELTSICPNHETIACAPAADEVASRGHRAAIAVNALAPLAAVGAAVGIALLVLDLSDDDRVGLQLSPTGAALTGRF
ncbi:MAG: hypothetical protein KC731_29635 [Myxococcales bacterium]|nr:hypothetical protein [Myxococcales bacterium]